MMMGSLFLTILLIVLTFLTPGYNTAKKTSGGTLLSDILDDLEFNADNRTRPGYGDKALEVHAFAFIRNIVKVDEGDSTITVNLLLMQMWNDARLTFDGGDGGKGSISEILIDSPEFMARFWNPDTFIVNEVSTASSPGNPILANQVVRLSPNGDVLKTSRLTVTVSCPMRYESYPFQSFDCDIEMESFGHKTNDIVYLWRNGSRSVDLSRIDKMTLSGKSGYSLQYVNTHSQQSYLDTGGSYSRLIIRFHFKKLWLRHAITYFLPTGLLAVVSLVSLWVVSTNYALGGVVANFIMAGMLILVTSLEYTTNRVLSHVPFLTPVDLHFGICLSAVFSSVAFHGVTLCCKRISNCVGRSSNKAQRKGHAISSESTTFAEEMDRIMQSNDQPKPPPDENVSYYESYDVTANDNDDDLREGEGTTRSSARRRSAVEDQEDFTVEGASTELVKKMHKKRSPVACIITATLAISKWISAVSFIIAEFVLWYTYGVMGGRGTNGGIFY